MPGSEEAFGSGHPSTFGESPVATTRPYERSEQAAEREAEEENMKAYNAEHPGEEDWKYPMGAVAIKSAEKAVQFDSNDERE